MNNPQKRRPVDFDFQPQRSSQDIRRQPTTSPRPAVQSATPTAPKPVDRPTTVPAPTRIPAPQPINDTSTAAHNSTLKPRRKKKVAKLLLGLCGLIIAALIAAFFWYQYQLSAVSNDSKKQAVRIESGSSPQDVAKTLKDAHLIRSQTAFYLYLLQSGHRNALQAGTYQLSPSQSSRDITHALVEGSVAAASVTFYPGAVIDTGPEGSAKTSVVTQLKNAGFSDEEISEALQATYDAAPLFAGRPNGASLEGYIYGDTYQYDESTTAQDLIKKSLDEFSQVVKENNLAAAYKKRGLTLYQGITLASIVQREISTNSIEATKDQKIIAQIFLSRLKKKDALGSDVTYLYGAALNGQTPSPSLDSPYNTRKVKGLPPGPIAVPGRGALLAVAQPASTDYHYFLSGDDDTTYFAKTEKQHTANIKAHCQKKCAE